MLIVIEGADGCGKDTVANAVAQELGAERLNFPNDNGYTGPAIRSYLRREWRVEAKSDWEKRGWDVDPKIGALAFQALQVANRMEVMPRLWQAAASYTRHLVLARYVPSAIVYGQLDGLDRKFLDAVHASMAAPTLSILLDAPPYLCLDRRQARDGAQIAPERYEGKLDMVKRLVELYRGLWAEHVNDEAWVRIDATAPVEHVIGDVMYAVRARLESF